MASVGNIFASILLAIGLIVGIGYGSASAADASQWRVYGFSVDGRYFAFGEYGIQDGSGAPYAHFYLLDLSRDAFVADTPIRVRYGEEARPLVQALRRQQRRAAPLLKRYRIEDPGRLLAARAPAEAQGDGRRLVFHPAYNLRISANRVALTIHPLEGLPRPSGCAHVRRSLRGFVLLWTEADGSVREIYRDRRIPASRNCPVDYELAAVIAPMTTWPPRYLVAIVRVLSPGFEGLDARLIAVPVPVPAHR